MVPSTHRNAIEPPSEAVQLWLPLSSGPATAVGVGAEVLAPDRVRLPFALWSGYMRPRATSTEYIGTMTASFGVREKLEASGFCAIWLALTDDRPIGSLSAG